MLKYNPNPLKYNKVKRNSGSKQFYWNEKGSTKYMETNGAGVGGTKKVISKLSSIKI